MRASLLAAAVFAGVLFVPRSVILAQAPVPTPTPAPSFEVAAVKANKSGAPMIRFGMQPGGRFTAENAPVRELLRFAFQIQPYQIEGAPGWVTSDRFDVTAKAEGDVAPTTPGQAGPIQFMMRGLLAERFGLIYHIETKEAPVFALTLAHADGKLGPKLTQSTADCAALFGRRGGGPGGAPPPPPGFGEKMQCGMRIGPGTIAAGATPVSQLANFLSQQLGRTVLDKTGLTGNYDFEVTYTPDQPPNLNGGPLPPGVQLPPIDPNGPSLSTAIQEQLGLKLDSQRGPVTTFVIDKISQPTPD
jgi:uncharacterized protein (TIGR03435 family)